MDGWLRLIVASLATWRITALLWYDNGPFDVFLKLRVRVGAHEIPPVTFWGKLLGCFWCTSFWVALVCTAVAWLWWYALLPFALSGAAILLSGGGRILLREMMSED